MKSIIAPFEVKEIKEEDEFYYIEGMASVYGNIDLGDDIVESGAFRQDLSKKGNQRPILWQHFSSEPIGIGIFEEQANGLSVKIKLPKEDQFVRERVIPQVKIGSVTGLSIGYVPQEVSYDRVGDRHVRRLKRCDLRETSAVTFPMNEEARIIAAKQYLQEHNILVPEENKSVPPYKNYALMPESTKWDDKKAMKQIREKTGSKDAPSATYKNGFMYFDPENADNFGAYKLPYVYVEDGEFKAVPKGLSAIVGAIRGARGGIDIPAVDKEKVQAQLNKYYKKMGREEPFKKGDITFIDNHTLNCLETKDISIIFEKDVVLSSQAKETLVNAFAHDKGRGSAQNEDSGFGDILKGLNEALNKKIKGE